jgi:hypothetical protein
VAAYHDGAPADADPAAAVTDVEPALDFQGFVDRHPYGTLAAALGVGYVLAGGLFTPLTGRLVRSSLRLGLRLAVLPYLEQQAVDLAARLATDRDGASGST